MALFDMLIKEGISFVVAHVNYGVREEAKKETEDLNLYCANNDIEIEVLYSKTKLEGNFEAKAREVRYQFFNEVCLKYNIDTVLVAHQQDDVIETYYLQRKRGGFVEYYGISEDTKIYGVHVKRPLLNYTKQELQEYCDSNHVPYAIDKSNLEQDFQRNVIRINIVSQMNPRERSQIIDEINKANEEIKGTYSKIYALDLTSVKDLLTLSDDLLNRALVIQARNIEPDVGISASLSLEIKKILESSKPNVSFKIHKGLVFNKEYDWCNFVKESKDVLYEFKLEEPRLLETQYFFLDFTLPTDKQHITLDDYPLTIRSPKDTDTIKINNYQSELRRLFIDWKMPASLRKRWPVIVNKNNVVVYVPRYRKDFKKAIGLNFFVKY